jgi:hypothetical protein
MVLKARLKVVAAVVMPNSKMLLVQSNSFIIVCVCVCVCVCVTNFKIIFYFKLLADP